MYLNKFKKTVLSLSLAISLLSPMTAFATNEWTMQSPGVYQMLDGSSLSGVIARGIDLSHYQGNVGIRLLLMMCSLSYLEPDTKVK